MPFKSSNQKSFLYMKHPEIAKKFAKHEKVMSTLKKRMMK